MKRRAHAYSYDSLDRLTAEVTNGVGVTTTYDLAGNRLVRGGVTGSYASVNGVQTDRLAAYGPDSFTYDAAGNLTNVTRSGVAWSYIWNARYQLTDVASNGIPVESYNYDALSRRVSTTSAGTTTYHVYDGNWQVLADLDANGTPLRSYTWAPGIDHLLAITVYTPDPEQTNSLQSNILFPITDQQGTVHALVDDTGSIVESYDYDAWGNLLAIRDASGSPINNRQSAINNRYLFQGREYSFATGLYHFRHRWYDPATGRWLSNDPIGIGGGMNQYVFCGGNPVNVADHSGLKVYGSLTLSASASAGPFSGEYGNFYAIDFSKGVVHSYQYAAFGVKFGKGGSINVEVGAVEMFDAPTDILGVGIGVSCFATVKTGMAFQYSGTGIGGNGAQGIAAGAAFGLGWGVSGQGSYTWDYESYDLNNLPAEIYNIISKYIEAMRAFAVRMETDKSMPFCDTFSSTQTENKYRADK